MINQFTKSITALLSINKNKPYFPGDKQLFLFTKRPILHHDFTTKYLQDAINEVQNILKNKGFLKNVSGKFDLETEAAVIEFQKENNLYVDGIVGPLTWACLFYPKLYRGIKDLLPEYQHAVKELQIILHKEGFLKKEPNNIFDKQTEVAVKRFQRIYGLKDDGIVGAATWAVLLGMRQKVEKKTYRMLNLLPLETLFWWNQLFMIVCIVVGIYYSPLPGDAPKFNLATALVTAYALTCIVPSLIDFLPPLKYFNQQTFPLLRYAPYVLTGIFWKPILNFSLSLFK